MFKSLFVFLPLSFSAAYAQLSHRYKDTALLTIRSKPKFAGEGYDKIPILKDAGAVSTICFELPDPATGKPPFGIEASSVAVTGAFCEFWGDVGCAGTPKLGARDGDVLDDLKLVPDNYVASYSCFF
ncbi:hypothetical protein TWF788_011285 [Orbilia oligospora]|uniref:Uncharacterized protein n=1 Tax=Orbilia oligospora TaxID=2813651 RepID=A0A7C8U4P4_ORBOL|nr:hypothetical protein TWF788_011285 [Orbilia oligospora]